MSNSNSTSLKGQWTALMVCYFGTLLMFIPYVGYTTQIPQMMEELSMNYTMVGMLASISSIAGGLILPFAGVLIDKWGAKKVMVLGLMILTIGQLIFAYMPNYEWLLFSRVILGIGIALLLVAPYTMAMRWFEQSNKLGISMGVMLATEGIGTVFATYVIAFIFVAFGWREGSAIGAIFLFVMLIITAIYLKEPPHFANVQREKSEPKSSLLKEYLNVIGRKNVIVTALFLVGIWGSYGIAVYWVPTLLIEDKGWSEGLAGFVAALYPLAGMICSIVFGLLSDRIGKRKPLILISGLGMTATFIGCAIALASEQYVMLAIMLPLSGFFAYGGLPLCYVLAADTVGVKLAATANAFALSIGFLLGAVVYPLALGVIKDMTGSYTIGFISAAISLIILNVLIPLLLAKDVKQASEANKDAELVI